MYEPKYMTHEPNSTQKLAHEGKDCARSYKQTTKFISQQMCDSNPL